jgi:predicted MFS family arabinose efflux permease
MAPALLSLSAPQNILRALRNPNFGVYTAGNAISLIGTWMHRVVTGWLTWELTHSATWLGLIAFADLFPIAVIGPIAGAVADRWDRLRVTWITQALFALHATLLFALTATDLITAPLLLLLAFFLGVAGAFNQPARLALMPALVSRDDLTTGVAINSVVFNLARFIGPAVAGVLLATAGIPLAYAVSAITFLAFVVALAHIRLPAEHGTELRSSSLVADLGAGLHYTASHAGIAVVLVLMIAGTVGVRPLIELLPAYAAEMFRSGASGLAILTSSVGAGAIFAGLWLGGRSNSKGLSRVLLTTSLLLACSGALFTIADHPLLAIPALVVTGFAMAASGISAQTLIQVAVDDKMRGRVLSIYWIVFRGGPAFGALILGIASDRYGLRLPLLVGALALLIVWVWARMKREHLANSLEARSVAPAPADHAGAAGG